MRYVLVCDDVVEKYPYSVEQLKDDNPNISFPLNVPDSVLMQYGVVPVRVVGMPTVGWDYEVVEQNPVLIDSTWHQHWSITKIADPEVLAAKIEDIQRDIVDRTQQRLDDFARTRNYDDINSIAKYKDITDEEIASMPVDEQALTLKFRAECRYLALATARTWARLYLVMDEVKAGVRPMPSSFAVVEPLLPALEWPV